jgi:hypothetical protein
MLMIFCALFNCQSTEPLTKENSFTRDLFTDLNDDFKVNHNLKTAYSYNADCTVSCLMQCNQNAECMSTAYSVSDNTCTWFNSTFCYGKDTVFDYTVILYRKVKDYGEYFSLFDSGAKESMQTEF